MFHLVVWWQSWSQCQHNRWTQYFLWHGLCIIVDTTWTDCLQFSEHSNLEDGMFVCCQSYNTSWYSHSVVFFTWQDCSISIEIEAIVDSNVCHLVKGIGNVWFGVACRLVFFWCWSSSSQLAWVHAMLHCSSKWFLVMRSDSNAILHWLESK